MAKDAAKDRPIRSAFVAFVLSIAVWFVTKNVAYALGALAVGAAAASWETWRVHERFDREALAYALLAGALAVATVVVAVAPSGPASAVIPSKPTTEREFVPPTGMKADGGVAMSRAHGGTCSRRSEVDPERTEAFQCEAGGNRPLDPCFFDSVIYEMLCFEAPWYEGKTKAAVPVYIANAPPIPKGVGAWRRPWALELAGHIKCLRSLGYHASAPVGASYECGRGASGEPAGWVVGGFPDESTSTWTVSYVPFGNPTGGASPVIVLEAWK